jgi:aspartate aminotransferase
MIGSKDIISHRTLDYFKSGSAIRRMFEEGLRLKQEHGPEQVADLSLGNPTFDPPTEFSEALERIATEKGCHAYMPNAGYPDVRERIANYLVENGFFDSISGSHIVMTTGAAGALNVILEAILDPGDEVIILRPYFVEYRFYVESHGGRIRFVDTAPDFSLDVEAVGHAVTPRTRAVIINSPNNPSGRIYSRAELEQLSAMLLDKQKLFDTHIMLLSDEPYRTVVFGERTFVSPASVYPNSFMCYSWSKAFNISGERIGYIAVNPDMQTDHLPELLGSLAMCNRFLGFVNAPAFMQRVIGEALDARSDIEHYRVKRDMLCDALEEGGYEFPVPEGAFYIFARTPGDEAEFVERARKNLLLVVPGTDFGSPGNFRISYAVPQSTVDLACTKLKELARASRLEPELL